MALDSSIGGSAANSYVSLTEADTYFAGHYSSLKTSAWAALTSTQKESVLKRACQTLESLRILDKEIGYGSLPPALVERGNYDYMIHRLMPLQILSFPRNIDVDNSNVGYIPQDVKDAQCEQAIHLLTFDESAILTRLQGISSETVSAGPVRIHQDFTAGGTMVAPMAIELMRKYLRPTTRVQRA